jgi:magnesium-protoporphyrin O-methyltransferase
MTDASYQERRGQIETYFDRTAVDAWKRLTSDAPVGRIRASVRAGRDQMRATLLGWLPEDLHGARILDAGCGTGALAVEAAMRGADVVAIDLSPTLVDLARERAPKTFGLLAQSQDNVDRKFGKIDFRAGDMLDPALGRFHYVIGMDSLIHYQTSDVVSVLAKFAERTTHSILFTYAPRTPILAAMISVGRLFPKRDRAPWIEPIATQALLRKVAANNQLSGWREGRTKKISSGFYTSQALELVRP